MKKKFLFFLTAGLLMILSACSTPEADEVLEYHNDFVDYTNPKIDEINRFFDEMERVETNEEAYEIEKNKITSVIKDIKDYVDEQNPKEDITKEYHQLRSKWADHYYESIETQNDAYKALLDGSEDKAEELFDESGEQMADANDYNKQANEKWDDIMDEFEFEEKEAS
ncbi:MAG TPA: hypothetical protein VK142_02455 [Bacillota bacterium]|nr:hypothetical protein [Bacillota bacterium]